MNKTRLEAFSDGVIAIIITIMVLEMKVPHDPTWHSLFEKTPIFISYVLSFIYVGIYWGNHHHLLHTVKNTTSKMILANLGLLFFLSLIPFSTGWVGETHFNRIPVFIYSLNLLLCAMAYYVLQQVIMKTWKHENRLISALKKQQRKGNISLVIYISSLVLALKAPILSIIGIFAVSILWLIPDKNIECALNEEKVPADRVKTSLPK